MTHVSIEEISSKHFHFEKNNFIITRSVDEILKNDSELQAMQARKKWEAMVG